MKEFTTDVSLSYSPSKSNCQEETLTLVLSARDVKPPFHFEVPSESLRLLRYSRRSESVSLLLAVATSVLVGTSH